MFKLYFLGNQALNGKSYSALLLTFACKETFYELFPRT